MFDLVRCSAAPSEPLLGRLLTGQSIARALGAGTGTGCVGSEVCVQRRSGKHAFALQVLPVTTACDELCLLLPGEARGAVVVITDPERQSTPPDAQAADFIRSHINASSLTSPMFTARNVFSSSLTISATRV